MDANGFFFLVLFLHIDQVNRKTRTRVQWQQEKEKAKETKN